MCFLPPLAISRPLQVFIGAREAEVLGVHPRDSYLGGGRSRCGLSAVPGGRPERMGQTPAAPEVGISGCGRDELALKGSYDPNDEVYRVIDWMKAPKRIVGKCAQNVRGLVKNAVGQVRRMSVEGGQHERE